MTPPPVLYVEDDDNDVLLMRRAWTKVNVSNPLQVVTDGQEALEYLSGEGLYANRVDHPMPCLVLLDLKLPKVLGLEVLRRIRSETALLRFACHHLLVVETTAGHQCGPRTPNCCISRQAEHVR